MEIKTLRIINLVSAVLAIFVAIFGFVSGIMSLTKLSSSLSWQANLVLASIGALYFALGALLGLLSYFMIEGFVHNKDMHKLYKKILLIAFSFEIVVFTLEILLDNYNLSYNIICLIFASLGLAAVFVVLFSSINEVVKGYIVGGTAIWGVVYSITRLSATVGVVRAFYVFSMFMYMSMVVYYVCKIVFDNTKTIENNN